MTSRTNPESVHPTHDKLHRFSPGVDTDRFSPGSGGADFRNRLDLSDAFVIGTLTRLRPAKEWICSFVHCRTCVAPFLTHTSWSPAMDRTVEDLKTSPASYLSTIGSSSQDQCPSRNSPPYDAMDVFALPTHTRRGEQTSKVWASSSWKLRQGVPILVGDSGGSVDAVQDGVTGNLIERIRRQCRGNRRTRTTKPVGREMGARGRQWMVDEWQGRPSDERVGNSWGD